MTGSKDRPLVIGGRSVPAGTRARIELPVARLPTQMMLGLSVEVVNGKRSGPCLWLSAAIHGDEVNGLEIIQRVLLRVKPERLRGRILAVPIVNVFGLIHQDRYMPDRRDLNRSFPGSRRGSLAARLAHLFMTEIVAHSTHGLDLHSGSNHRTNLPQVRGDLRDRETRRIAEAFGAPFITHGDAPAGSLRRVAARRGIPNIVYEAGEPLRFDEEAIATGVRGVLTVMGELEMLPRQRATGPRTLLEGGRRTWVRAARSGILRLRVGLGDTVQRGQILGVITDAYGDERGEIRSRSDGLVIGHTKNPLVYQGDAVVHLAREVKAVRRR